jgi:glycogen debranching enzyme
MLRDDAPVNKPDEKINIDTDTLVKRARAVLERNLVKGKNFIYTCPSQDTYQHQWLWDSCFHAIMWAHFDPAIAMQELLTLTRKQFENGMLPHMLYWRPATGFKPRMGDLLFGGQWPEKDRSHITQPPLLAQAAAAVFEKTRDQKFLSKILAPMQGYYDWLNAERSEQVSADGLVAIIHPWESGMDLLPIWDHIHHIQHLFGIRTGRWLGAIIREYNRVGWNIQLIKNLHGPNHFCVNDVSFNCIYIRNLQVLAELCDLGGDKNRATIYRRRAATAQKSLELKCWDEKTGFFYSIDAITGEAYPEITISGLFPLILSIDRKKAERLVRDHVLNEEEFWLPYPLPCVAKSSPKFNPRGSLMALWRGPNWICMSWYVVRGLQHLGFEDIASKITAKLVEMVLRSGFREQYNPFTGEGYGAKNFGWSTLAADLMMKS